MSRNNVNQSAKAEPKADTKQKKPEHLWKKGQSGNPNGLNVKVWT
jgi:hypothetical protein